MGCCVCGADDFSQGWERWDDHPARRQWDVIKDLGTGAMSQVVLARHRQTGEMAALKVVFLESPAVVDDPEHLATLTRESDLLGMLEHPHVVECKDVIRSPRQLVLVLEWLRGGQVIDRLHELGLQYSEQQAAAIFVQVAEAVAHLHEYGILHRDIKPENVMFATPPTPAGPAPPLTAAALQAGRKAPAGPPQSVPVVKLVDLGMACLYDPNKAQRGALGSPGFVAPEVVQEGVHTPAMDVFSLGVLLFIMLVGRKPFNIKESENLRYAVASLQEAPGLKDPRWLDLSPDAKHLVMGMLAYDPARRLTMQQVLTHEWVVSRGGILPRPLGQDVVFGAATVASIRRLRNLCGGVVAFNRAAAAASDPGAGGKAGRNGLPQGDSAKDAYLRRLKQSQRLEHSSRGGSVMNRLAASLAGSAYAKAHDAGGSVHPAADVSVRRGAAMHGAGAGPEGSQRGGRFGSLRGWRRGEGSRGSLQGGSLHGWQLNPSTSRSTRLSAALPGGLHKSGTSVMLSEMERSAGSSRDVSTRSGRDARQQAGLARPPSTLQLLSAAAKAYMEGSTHGGSRRGGRATAAAGAAAAGGGGALRQVADDSNASLRRQQQQSGGFAQLAALADDSTAGSESSKSSRAEGAAQLPATSPEGRQRGTAAAALAAGLPPERCVASICASRTASGGLPALSDAQVAAAAAAATARLAQQPRPGAPPATAAAALAAVVPGAAPASLPAAGSSGRSSRELSLDGLRPHVVVQRRSLDNPLTPAGTSPPVINRTWQDMQAHLRQQTPRSGRNSREGTTGSTPGTRVVRLKPLE